VGDAGSNSAVSGASAEPGVSLASVSGGLSAALPETFCCFVCSGIFVLSSEEKKKKNSRPNRNTAPMTAKKKGSFFRGERPRSWIYSGSFSVGRSCSVRAILLFEKLLYSFWDR